MTTTTDRWVSNLESGEKVKRDLETAQASLIAAEALDDEDTLRIAQAARRLAELRYEGWTATMALLAVDYPGFVIGKPRATRQRTAAAIERDGIVGIYRANDVRG